MRSKDFIACILTHGRPEKVATYASLRKSGYTGKVCILLDNEDKTYSEYVKKFGSDPNCVIRVFDKKAIADTFDEGDNFEDRRAIVYARNASFSVVKELGYRYFIQLDDDYLSFDHRVFHKGKYTTRPIKCLDKVFACLVRFFVKSKAVSVAMAQGGDFIGGSHSPSSYLLRVKRKCMNTFVCDSHKPFTFVGRINEDVNTYVVEGSRGGLFVTLTQVSIVQRQTQSTKGGMTELYLASGTYVKSFYTIMYAPSCTTIRKIGPSYGRMHHNVTWKNAVPVIVSPIHKKK